MSAPIGHFDGISWFAGNNPKSEDGYSFEGDCQLFITKVETLYCLSQFLVVNILVDICTF